MAADGDHWTTSYKTDPLVFYETEGPVFENPELTLQEIELIQDAARALGGSLESPVLDLACGPGRHGRLLARRGHRVVGLDLSLGLLQAGRTGGRLGGDRARAALVCGDLNHLPLPERTFNSVLLLGKSFGFFPDRQNLDILRSCRALLRPGGFFGLELPDREPYLASVPALEREVRTRANGDRLVSEYRSRWRAESRRLEVDERHEVAATGETLWAGVWDLRLYDGDEVKELMREAGFAEIVLRQARLVEAQGAKGDVLIVGAIR